MGENAVSTFEGERSVPRAEAVERMRAAVLINAALCPGAQNSGLYAQDFIVPAEISRSYYTASSIGKCEAVVMALPCSSPDSSFITMASYYRSAIRLCNPEPAGMD